MPLKDSKNDLFSQKLREHNRSPFKRGTTLNQRLNQSRIGRESDVKTTNTPHNPLGAADVVPRNEEIRRMLASKISVPNTIVKKGQSAGQEVPLVSSKSDVEVKKEFAESQNPQKSSQPVQHTDFDNTESLEFDDYDSFEDDYENPTMVLRHDYVQPLQTTMAEIAHKQSYKPVLDEVVSMAEFDDGIWEEEVAIERHLRQKEQLSRAGNRSRTPDEDEDENAHNHIPTNSQPRIAILDTPLRPCSDPPARISQPNLASKTVSFDSPTTRDRHTEVISSPDLGLARNYLSFRPAQGIQQNEHISQNFGESSNTYPISTEGYNTKPQISKSQARQEPQRSTDILRPISTFESSRASDHLTSSEDDVPMMQSKHATFTQEQQNEKTTRKRVRENELDYSLHTLRSMKFEDLDREDFSKDPQEKNSPAAFDQQGNVMTLLQRLNNLDKMTHEDQKSMFRSQSDQEWAQMGPWFIEKFRNDLKRIMEIRLDRRKISMKYEDQARRRQKEVEWSVTGVDTELDELKQGGGELIRGRDASSRRGTPRRA